VRRWLTGPVARRVTLGLLLLGFALLVAVYMQVVNRYVARAVRIELPAAVAAGSQGAVRLTVYHPNRGERVRGEATLAWSGASPGHVPSDPIALDSDLLAPTWFTMPGDGEAAAFSVSVRFPESEAVHHFEVEVPAVEPLPTLSRRVRHLRGLQRSERRPPTAGLGHTPLDADIRLSLVAEHGRAVRFLSSRFFVRASTRDGQPLAYLPVTVSLGDTTAELTTDAHGLADFEATLQDITVGTASTAGYEARVEVTPAFDGMNFSHAPACLTSQGGFDWTLDTALPGPFHADLYTGGGWNFAGRVSPDRIRLVMPETDRTDIARLQVYRHAMAAQPQAAISTFLIVPAGADCIASTGELVTALAAENVDRPYLEALRSAGLPNAHTSEESRRRLTGYLLSQLPPVVERPAQVIDDADSQTEQLLAETVAFRKRAHRLIAIGTLGLILWIVWRVSSAMVETKRRTREVLLEVDSPELALTGGFGASAGPMGLVWIAALALTLTGFLIGILLLLASM